MRIKSLKRLIELFLFFFLNRLAEIEAKENKDNAIAHSEFKILIDRVDTMESSIGNIVNRVCIAKICLLKSTN